MAGLARSTSSQLGRQPSRDAPLSLGTGAAPLQLGRSRSQSVRSPLLMSPIPALRKDQDADASLNNNEKQRMLENASSMDQLSTPFAGAAAQRKLAPRRAPAMLRSLAGASAVAVLLVGCIVATDAGARGGPRARTRPHGARSPRAFAPHPTRPSSPTPDAPPPNTNNPQAPRSRRSCRRASCAASCRRSAPLRGTTATGAARAPRRSSAKQTARSSPPSNTSPSPASPPTCCASGLMETSTAS